jgi:hypothetical protein
MINRNKRTLERRMKANPLVPDVRGGGGRPNEWLWTRIRSWLTQEFGKRLPDHFPRLHR